MALHDIFFLGLSLGLSHSLAKVSMLFYCLSIYSPVDYKLHKSKLHFKSIIFLVHYKILRAYYLLIERVDGEFKQFDFILM